MEIEAKKAEGHRQLHDLKCHPEYFEEVWQGRKTFELRRDDRGFQVDDDLRLREWSPETGVYSGRVVYAVVTYIVRDAPQFGLLEGFAVLGLDRAIIRTIDGKNAYL